MTHLNYTRCPRCGSALDFSPDTPDVRYLRNGDPGYPGDPAEVECTNSLCWFGEDEEEYDDTLEKACEEWYERDADIADALYSEWKDERA